MKKWDYDETLGKYTNIDTLALLNFKKDIDSDDIKIKESIKKILLNNRFIIHVLNNQELEDSEAEPDEYFGVNILPFYLIPDIQHSVNNFICYEVNYDELNRYNSCVKTIQVVFHILCRQEGIIDKDTGVAKHDLLAALLQDQFNYSLINGIHIQLVSDVATTTDTNYVVRTLTFEHTTDNNLTKTRTVGGQRTPILSNKLMIYESEQT